MALPFPQFSKDHINNRAGRMKRIAEVYRERYSDSLNPLWVERARRFTRLVKREGALNKEFGSLFWMKGKCSFDFDVIMAEAVRQGLSFCAIDTEFENKNGRMILNEIGLSGFKDGVIKSTNIRINGYTSKSTFHHGITQNWSAEEAAPIVQEIIDTHDVIIFYSRSCDEKVIKNDLGIIIPNSKVLDMVNYRTFSSGTTTMQFHTLRGYCAFANVDLKGAHVGGNDSHALMVATKVLFGMGSGAELDTVGATTEDKFDEMVYGFLNASDQL